MKKIMYFLSIASVLMLWTGCNDDGDSTNDSGFSVVKSEASFDAEGGDGYVQVNSTDYSVASTEPTWCHVTKAGTMINVTVDPFESLESRNSEVLITSGGKVYRVPVSQAGAIVSFPLGVVIERVQATPDAIDVTANTDYTVSVAAPGDEWLTATKTETGITLAAMPNNTRATRYAKVRFTRPDGVYTEMPVSQIGVIISVANVTIPNAPAGVATNVTVTSNAAYTVSVVAPDNAWLSAATISGGIALTASTNNWPAARAGKVRFTWDASDPEAYLDQSFTQAAPAASVIYAGLLGAGWRADYNNGTAADYDAGLTMTQVTANSVLSFNLLAPYGLGVVPLKFGFTATGDVTFTFQSTGYNITWNEQQGQQLTYWTPFMPPSSLNTAAVVSLKATPTIVDGKIVLQFKDAGNFGTTVWPGIACCSYSSGWYLRLVYLNLTLTKPVPTT